MTKITNKIFGHDSGTQQAVHNEVFDQSATEWDHFTYDAWTSPMDQFGIDTVKVESGALSNPPLTTTDSTVIQNLPTGNDTDHQPTPPTGPDTHQPGTSSVMPPPWADQFWVHGVPPVPVPPEFLV